LQSDRRHRSGTYAFGTALFLMLAVVLAFASGDLMLVLAVVTATAGLGLLATQRKRVVAPRPAMVQRVAPAPPTTLRRAASSRGGTARPMAERRSRPVLADRSVVGAGQRGSGSKNAGVADPARQAQPVQVLQ